MHHAVNEPAIAVEREDHIDVAGKQRVERNIVHAVGMIVGAHQRAEIHDIHDAHFDAGHMLLQQPGCGAGFDGGNVAGARQHDVRLVPPSLVAKFQIDAPCEQCASASSKVSHCNSGCFPQVTTLM